MGNYRPLSTKCWQNYLSENGYTLNRISSSHHQWTKKGFRTIPVWGDEKQIPPFHLKKSCESMGKTLNDLYTWAEKNC